MPQLMDPLPVLPDRPIPPSIKVRLATVAAKYSWNYVLARLK
ncbi:MAG: hypothetical protein OXE17_01665 [Chloroflexi bacterium]|nr:hypothetical protein [Chloroflexota bacterium]